MRSITLDSCATLSAFARSATDPMMPFRPSYVLLRMSATANSMAPPL